MQQTWINGVACSELAVNDRGLSYGDGLFETIAVYEGKPHLLDAHLQRLARGLERLRFPAGQLDLLQQEIGVLPLVGNQVLKITLTRGLGERGYSLPQTAAPTRIISLAPLPDFADKAQQGVVLRSCQLQLAISPVLAGLKHLNRLEQVLARSEWDDPAISEGVLTDTEGKLVEGTMSNLFWVADGQLFTPALDRCGVQGVMRDHLIELYQSSGGQVTEGYFTPDSLAEAEEIFMCNSLIGVWPVIRLDEKVYEIGTVSRALQADLKQETGH